jgi:hypothetical protein
MASGKEIASRVPGPDKLGKGYGDAGGADESEGDSEAADEAKAAKVSSMQSFLDVLGIKGVDAEAACDALEDYLDSR